MTAALLIAAGLLFLVIGWLMIAPVYCLIDSDKSEYRVYQRGTFSAQFLAGGGEWVEIKIAGMKVSMKGPNGSEKKTRAQASEKPSRRSRSLDAWIFLVKRITSAIKVEACMVNVDTDDYPVNAMLTAPAALLNYKRTWFNINYRGRMDLYLKARFRPVSIMWAFLLFLTKK